MGCLDLGEANKHVVEIRDQVEIVGREVACEQGVGLAALGVIRFCQRDESMSFLVRQLSGSELCHERLGIAIPAGWGSFRFHRYVIEHGECRTDFVEHDRVVFVVNVGLHGAEERVTQYSVRGGTVDKSDRDRGGRPSTS